MPSTPPANWPHTNKARKNKKSREETPERMTSPMSLHDSLHTRLNFVQPFKVVWSQPFLCEIMRCGERYGVVGEGTPYD